MLHRQPSSKDQARKLWGTILALRYFGPAKVVKERVGWGSHLLSRCAVDFRISTDDVIFAR
jgi:hypothetical protein